MFFSPHFPFPSLLIFPSLCLCVFLFVFVFFVSLLSPSVSVLPNSLTIACYITSWSSFSLVFPPVLILCLSSYSFFVFICFSHFRVCPLFLSTLSLAFLSVFMISLFFLFFHCVFMFRSSLCFSFFRHLELQMVCLTWHFVGSYLLNARLVNASGGDGQLYQFVIKQ